MALIQCPECGRQVSNQAKACIHCGYPLERKNDKLNFKLYHIRRSSSQKNDSKKFLNFMLQTINIDKTEAEACTKYYRSFANNALYDDAKKLQKLFEDNNLHVIVEEHINTTEQNLKPLNLENYLKLENVPTCPKCGSTSITTSARGVDGFWGFLGASSTVNRCANCGHAWYPSSGKRI